MYYLEVLELRTSFFVFIIFKNIDCIMTYITDSQTSEDEKKRKNYE